MRSQWIVRACLIIAVLASLVNCSQAAPVEQREPNPTSIAQTPTITPPIRKEPVETQPEGIISTIPTEETTQPPVGIIGTPGVTLPTGDTAAYVSLAKQDLAKKLRIPVESITVMAVIGQEFSQAAFYCQTVKERIAKDDSPAAISGFSILLQASGQRYEYHASGQTVIFCRPLG